MKNNIQKLNIQSELKKFDPIYDSVCEFTIIAYLLYGADFSIAKNIEPCFFYNSQCALIFTHIKKIGRTLVSPVEFIENLSKDELCKVGGMEAIAEMSLYIASNKEYRFEYAIEQIKQQYNLRKIKEILYKKLQEIHTDSDVLISTTKYELDKLNIFKKNETVNFDIIKNKIWENVDLYNLRKAVFYKTGLTCIDSHFEGGLHKRGFYILAARTHVGKTDFAMEMAIGLLNNGYRVRYDMLELTYSELYENMLAKITGCSRGWLVSGKANKEALSDAKEIMSDWGDRLTSAEKPYSIDELELWLKKFRNSIDILFIDQFSFLVKPSNEDKTLDKINSMIRHLLRLTIEFELPIILLHQINREGVSFGGKQSTPEMHNLKDSGHMEETADVVMILKRTNPKSLGDDKNYSELMITKDRLAQKAGRFYKLDYKNFHFIERF